MSVYFVFECRIFVMMENTNDVCYFLLKMFVIMGSISDLVRITYKSPRLKVYYVQIYSKRLKDFNEKKKTCI